MSSNNSLPNHNHDSLNRSGKQDVNRFDPEAPKNSGTVTNYPSQRLIFSLDWHGLRLSVVSLLGILSVFGFGLSNPDSSRSCLSGQSSVSLVDYLGLREGMSLTDAQAALGRAIEVSQSKSVSTYEWRNCDGTLVSATFDQGRLIDKSQRGF